MRLFGGIGRTLAGMRIGVKLGGAFALVLVFATFMGINSQLSLQRVNAASSDMSAKWLPGIGQLNALRLAVLDHRSWQEKLVKTDDAGYQDDYREKMNAAMAAIGTARASYELHAEAGEEARLSAEFGRAISSYVEINRRVLEQVQAGKLDDAHDISDGAAVMAFDDTLGALDRLTQFNFAAGQQSAENAAMIYRRARMVEVALLVSALAIGAVLAFIMTRNLLRQLGGEPREASRVACAVAQGDLSSPIPVRPGDAASLIGQLAEMQASLVTVVGAVRSAADRLSEASSGMAQGNQDLANRTAQQKMALEHTATSIDTLGDTVRQNAQNAHKADELARGASDVAASGGAVVAQVVDTMKGINESSRKIADIISVIDGIAFQTNILALNAAVEAARAGEQGRGFAVVASEVRNLAQRSAGAAREIKSLISTSVERVEQGTGLVDRAGATMRDVVTSIRTVSQIVAEISLASEQQSRGVEQVGAAIVEMERTTQQNVGLVGQSAESTQRLMEQARELVDAVGVFKLQGTSA